MSKMGLVRNEAGLDWIDYAAAKWVGGMVRGKRKSAELFRKSEKVQKSRDQEKGQTTQTTPLIEDR